MSVISWKNLKIGKCPKCAFDLKMRGLLEPQYHCTNLNCDFYMGEQAYVRTIKSMQEQIEEKEENIKEFE